MTASQMIAKVRNLPPVSRAALELSSLLGSPDTSNEDVVRVLRQDSVLTAKLLRVCNSSALGLEEQVASVDQAVFILGHGQIYQMVTALAFNGSLAVPLQAYSMEGDFLWRHSILSATAAQFAASECSNFEVDASVAFTAGLLHDIGKLITNEFFTREAAVAIRSQITEGRSFAEAEKSILGADHAEVGAALLYIWRLPDLIVEAVALHHQPVIGPRPRLSTLSSFADTLAHRAAALHAGQDVSLLGFDPLLLNSLGVGSDRLDALVARVCAKPVISDESS